MKRREFVSNAMAGGMVLLAGRRAVSPQSRLADANVEILVNEPIGRIAPEVYGHFAEHLGGVVYDGIWVGENSRIANIGGIRKALVDAMERKCLSYTRNVKPSSLRGLNGSEESACC
ncbi:MAG: hypothetical protein ABI882_18155 [Acidobacteriota bacterium]